MKLQRLHIKRYGRFDDFAIDFGKGFNQIIGDNDTGKSTLVRAIYAVLFDNPATVHWEGYHANLSTMEAPYLLHLEYQANGKSYRLTKDIATETTMLEEVETGGKWNTPADVQEQIGKALGFTEKELYVASSLVRQDDLAGVELATGSLGHGLPVGLGMALAARIQQQDYRVFVVMSDGECNEGSVWEAAMFAPAQRLEKLAVVVDYNKWQATGRSNEIMALDSLAKKWEAFGWHTLELDGHDLPALVQAMNRVPVGNGKPLAIVAHTIKGKGVSFMEDDNNWHYRSPKADEVAEARRQLGIEAP